MISSSHSDHAESTLGPPEDVGDKMEVDESVTETKSTVSLPYLAAKKLVALLDPLNNIVEEPVFILCFDEAQPLTEGIQGKWNRFSELCRVLRHLRDLPIFSLFLSTTGKFHNFSPAYEVEASHRIRHFQFSLFSPITHA
ncbi:hypothetical protein B0H10DRAFT_2237501 [Mycena sp. CBHHK59/15]|nr:hypothetical protein B0H10DRAFT_2237501 [Mycena sp. CBHHK59/15]